MFKPLPPGTVGRLTNVVYPYARVIEVDAVLYEILSEELGVGDWTYLYLTTGSHVEVVRVTGTNLDGTVNVGRAQEGTGRTAFPAKTVVHYGATLAGIEDVVRQSLQRIIVTGLDVPEVIVRGTGDLEIVADSVWFDGNISKCKPFKCPQYGFGPFYYTSKIYPIEYSEAMQGRAWLHRALGSIDAVDFFQPQVQLVSAQSRSITQYYTIEPEHIQPQVVLVSAQSKEIVVRYSVDPVVEAHIIQPQVVLVSAESKNIVIHYSADIENIQPRVSLVSASSQ